LLLQFSSAQGQFSDHRCRNLVCQSRLFGCQTEDQGRTRLCVLTAEKIKLGGRVFSVIRAAWLLPCGADIRPKLSPFACRKAGALKLGAGVWRVSFLALPVKAPAKHFVSLTNAWNCAWWMGCEDLGNIKAMNFPRGCKKEKPFGSSAFSSRRSRT